jgi:hypothetical protein
MGNTGLNALREPWNKGTIVVALPLKNVVHS